MNHENVRSVSNTPTTLSAENEVSGLVTRVERLDLSSWKNLRDALVHSGYLQQLRFRLKEKDVIPDPRDSFRRARGFQVLCHCLGQLASLLDEKISTEELRESIQILSQILFVLEAALTHHTANTRYFRTKLSEDGWPALFKHLRGLQNTLVTAQKDDVLPEQYYGVLYAAAVGDESLVSVYSSAARTCLGGSHVWTPKDVDVVTLHILALLDDVSDISVPELLPVIVKLWRNYPFTSERKLQTINIAIPVSLKLALSTSRRNVVRSHAAGLLNSVLPLLFSSQRAPMERLLFQDVALLLCEQGLTSLDDTRILYVKAAASLEGASFLLRAAKLSRQPASIQFDLSRNGVSSIELPTLRRSFPPVDADGYSVSLWLRVDRFDPAVHTTFFGVYDKSHTCFVLVYLDRETRHLVLQTSVKGSKPSVRFKSTTFESELWYHICIVHRRPKTISSSKASLFVNGKFMEQMKVNYPLMVPSDRAVNKPQIQSFLGTPQDLAPSIDGVYSSVWSLASAVLFQTTLTEDLVAVIFALGSKYHGNFQDCLGSFNTYAASAALSLRNETLYANHETKSTLSIVTKHRGADALAEREILLNISPTSVLDNDDRNHIDESQLIRSLSRRAAKNLRSYIQEDNSVAINGAVPAVNDALIQPNGVAMFVDGPIATVPQSLDDMAWRLGGCVPICLGLVAHARTTEEVALTVEILCATIKDSWRNSEVAERNNLYSILSMILKDKMLNSPVSELASKSVLPAIPTSVLDRNGLALRLLELILCFVGYDLTEPTESIINNALAYKVLLIDCTVWKHSCPEVQALYFRQFVVLARHSKYTSYNLKRLNRMRAFKRLMDALKGEQIPRTTISLYRDALSVLLPSALSAETLRSVALFITYSLYKQNGAVISNRSERSRTSSNSSTMRAARDTAQNLFLSKAEVGVEMLKMYTDLLCQSNDDTPIKKFAKAVTNRWLLYLISETSSEVVVLSTRILARLLVVHGEDYVRKFRDKAGGFSIMAQRLRRWWYLPALWPILFAILFGLDVARLDLARSFDLYSFIEMFNARKEHRIVYPEMLEVIAALLQSGLRSIVSSVDITAPSASSLTVDNLKGTSTRMSMSSVISESATGASAIPQRVDTFNTIVRFLSDLQSRSSKFREFATSSSYVQYLLTVLFPVAVGADALDASVELNARDSTLTFDGTDIPLHPFSSNIPTMRALNESDKARPARAKTFRRESSFVLLPRGSAEISGTPKNLEHTANDDDFMSSRTGQETTQNITVQSVLELVIAFYVDRILHQKDFPGLGLSIKTPPGFLEQRIFFQTWILSNTVSQLSNVISLDQRILCNPTTLNNTAKFLLHLTEAILEGWYLEGSGAVIDFACGLLEYLQRPDVAKLKSVRLCAQVISAIRGLVLKLILFSLSQLESTAALLMLKKIRHWQNVLLAPGETHSRYLQLLCYLLYGRLVSSDQPVRLVAAALWRTILVQRPEETAAILIHTDSSHQQQLTDEFLELTKVDNDAFLKWIDENKEQLDTLFSEKLLKSWNEFIVEENAKVDDLARGRMARRKEKLRAKAKEDSEREGILKRHEITFEHWTTNIHSSEVLKHQRCLQDQQDDLLDMGAKFAAMQRELGRTTGLFKSDRPSKWRVDQTEGRNRMRLRLVEDVASQDDVSEPRRKGSDLVSLQLNTDLKKLAKETTVATPTTATTVYRHRSESAPEPFPDMEESGQQRYDIDAEEGFEIVENPNLEQQDFEDKNRKVMRTLNRGDQVKHVANVSRIAGLEAVEGLLILGKDSIYLVDEYFQRADHEIVHVWQAPVEERDPYVSMISGRDLSSKTLAKNGAHEVRSWKWTEVITASKRRFLFRDVAVEIFFGDGRSYLLIFRDTKLRNELYTQINGKILASNTPDHSNLESAWRLETMKSAEEEPQTLGARFANVFTQSTSLAATKKWQKGDMSNFHYLMLINTLAGRTYNDLTQYPVFPWVIADYTSAELDLENPRTFRDLSKPMGCQHSDREAEFRERYKQIAEMGETHPFHYGTHYSSAMIVTGYLVRLQPYVKSYLLLQGGSFDHADRMFFSVEGAWTSASRSNMTDVRELTPEFYYLPEFLTNVNGYDFGVRQRGNESIDNVELPPWAKGDPKVFIAKQRQALESPYVSKNLHRWIDLVFGFKQKGEAAVEAVNVFHHLSYYGATDLDAMADSRDKLAAIGIIHNFGQTPLQLFHRPHPAREHMKHKYRRLDSAAESLTRVPGTLLESDDRIASLVYSWKTEKLLCASAFRLNMPPTYEKYMEWGFFDNSVRFYAADSRKQIGLYENLHVGQLSCALFADSKSLITAGGDGVVQVWSINSSSTKFVDLQHKASLFGHRSAITTLALSRSSSTLLSCSSGGELILWDLNRCEFVRRIIPGKKLSVQCAVINDINGNVIICHGTLISVYTLNGEHLVTQSTSTSEDMIMSVACYEGAVNEWLERDLIFTGHRHGVVRVWHLTINPTGRFELELIRQLNHVDLNREDDTHVSGGITCILLQPQVVYTGDEDGRVVSSDRAIVHRLQLTRE